MKPLSTEKKLLIGGFILIVLASIPLAISLRKVENEIEDRGLKGILTQIWEGEPKGSTEVIYPPKSKTGFPCWIGDEHIKFKLVYADSVAYAECGSCGALIKLKKDW